MEIIPLEDQLLIEAYRNPRMLPMSEQDAGTCKTDGL